MAGRNSTAKEPEERDWLALATEQLDSYAVTVGCELKALAAPPEGNQAAQKRELRRRARIPHLQRHLTNCQEAVRLTREALQADPQAARAVYHAPFVGMLWLYPYAEESRETRLAKREAADETNLRRKASRVVQINSPGR